MCSELHETVTAEARTEIPDETGECILLQDCVFTVTQQYRDGNMVSR